MTPHTGHAEASTDPGRRRTRATSDSHAREGQGTRAMDRESFARSWCTTTTEASSSVYERARADAEARRSVGAKKSSNARDPRAPSEDGSAIAIKSAFLGTIAPWRSSSIS